MSEANGKLLEVKHVDVVYHVGQSRLAALDDVSFDLQPGEIVGVVGESGCGKSTLASTLLRLLPPNAEVARGEMWFKGRDLARLPDDDFRGLRGSEIAMVFQDPLTSLNPTFKVGTQMVDAQRVHDGSRRSVLQQRAIEMLEQVGIPDAGERIHRFPHEFSGGMRQRIMIAMALMLKPALLIADEPTSALDVTLQAQILELLNRLRKLQGTAILFVSHDLGVVAEICDRVVVMYAGRAVEQGDVHAIFEEPRHPYTQRLLAAMPSRRHRGSKLATIAGRVPNLAELPAGCTFADRCPHVQSTCRRHVPRDLEIEGRRVRCHIYDPESDYEPTPGAQLAGREFGPAS
jgi:oligopeptide/dipeptide ABC transporter ATP-binding protein